MATENKLMLLNLAVKHLGAGEVYVEIGTWHGLSLAGAANGHPSVLMYACDNFSQFEGSRVELEANLKRWTAIDQVHFYDMDFRRFLDLAPWRPARVGVYFYDGGHKFTEQFGALHGIVPSLSNEALLFIDDTNWGRVRSANKLFAKIVQTTETIADIRTNGNGSPSWWNGIQVLRYTATGAKSTVLARAIDYHSRQLFWDGLVPAAGRLFQFVRRGVRVVPGLRPLYRRVRAARHQALRDAR